MRHTSGRRGVFYVILLICGSLTSCSPPAKTIERPDADYKTLATEKYGEGGACQSNEDASLVLCNSSMLIMTQRPGIQFFTYNVAESRVTFESEVTYDAVRWVDLHHVEVIHSAGTVQKNAAPAQRGFLLDARTGVRSGLK